MNRLDELLELVEALELRMVEDDVIEDGDVYSDYFADIKDLLYKESVKQISIQ